MRSKHHRTLVLLSTLTAACGGAPFTASSDTSKVGDIIPAMDPNEAGTPPSSGSLSDSPTLPEAGSPPPTSSGSSFAGSGSSQGSGAVVVVDPPTIDAGVPSGAMSGSLGASGSMVGGSGGSLSGSATTLPSSMSGSLGGSGGVSSGSVVSGNPTPTCVGASSQACGNCQTGTSTRTCDNGVWSAWGVCNGATLADLTGVDEGTFSISFDLTDTATTTQAVLNQRNDCQGVPIFWDIILNSPNCNSAGSLEVDTYNSISGKVFHCTSGGINGHHVQLHRVGGVISYSEDGVVLATWSDLTNLAGLPILAIGTDTCLGIMPLAGTLTNVCVEKE